MFKSVAAVELGGAGVFGFGFKAVATCGNIFLDELQKFRTESSSAEFFSDVYFLDPDDPAARLLRVSVGKNSIAGDLPLRLEDESIAVRRAGEEKIEGGCYILFGNILKHRGRGIKILRHFGVDGFVVFCNFSDYHSFF